MLLTLVGSLSLTEAITLRALTVDHAIVVYCGNDSREYLIEILHIRFCHCEGGASMEQNY